MYCNVNVLERMIDAQHIVAYRPVAGQANIQALLFSNGFTNKHVPTAMNTHATIEELLEWSFLCGPCLGYRASMNEASCED
jgi:hypothetical protein